MKSSMALPLVGLAGIMLVIGAALGAAVFPMTITRTTTEETISTLTIITPVPQSETQTVTQESYFVIFPGNDSLTVTEEILTETVVEIQIYTSGNCTVSGGTEEASIITTTEYLLPSQVNNSSSPVLVNAALTTVSSSEAGIGSTNFTTVSFDIHDQYVTGTIVSTRTNGTVTYAVTAVCPIFS